MKVKLDTNKMQFFDSLLKAGSNRQYYDDKKKLNYSEYSGVFNIEGTEVRRIIVNTMNNVKIGEISDTLLPQNVYQIENYEFMFHTHPSLNELTRFKNGIIYEFPSANDILHFIHFFNNGRPKSSLTITNEGIYNTISTKKKGELIIVDNIYKCKEQISKAFNIIQNEAILKYDKKFNEQFFYKHIAQNKKYIKLYNNHLKTIFKGQILIKFYPRKYDKQIKKWLLPNLYLK